MKLTITLTALAMAFISWLMYEALPAFELIGKILGNLDRLYYAFE
jgi:hypothetical protein